LLGNGAAVAQRTVNPLVGGSNPPSPAKFLTPIKYNMIQNLEIETQESLLDNLRTNYREYIEDLRKNPIVVNETAIRTEGYYELLSSLIHCNPLDNFTPKNFFWINLIDDLLWIDELTMTSSKEEDFEELIYAFWEDSEYAGDFFQLIQEQTHFTNANLELINLLSEHILGFYYLQILEKYNGSNPVLYRIQEDMGDSDKIIRVGEASHYFELLKEHETFPTLMILEKQKSKIILSSRGNRDEIPLQENQSFIEISSQKILPILFPETLNEQQVRSISTKITRSINTIKNVSPYLLETFCNFTNVLIPITQKELVSHSIQELPGYSSINFSDRDFVDCIDDLMHENGHHILNCILNITELIFEDDEKIYYSPWRRSLRPIRGLYHAYCTFYWAAKLFHELSMSIITSKDKNIIQFDNDEKQKIYSRFLEEYYMLSFCHDQIEIAYREDKKISKEGYNIYQLFKNNLLKLENDLSTIEEKLIDSSLQETLADLKKELKNNSDHYNLKRI
jgi:hypothetical protein